MRDAPLFKGTLIGVALISMGLVGGPGCSGVSGGGSGGAEDELVAIETEMPGRLLVLENHDIGSYDAFLIPPALLAYRRGSTELSEDLEEAFKAQLEQSLIDEAQDAGVPIVQEPGPCVMVVGIGLVGLDVGSRRKGAALGEMTLVMQLRDSLSGQPLLHHEVEQRVEDDGSGDDATDQILWRFDGMTRELDLAGTLRAVRASEHPIREECQGRLAALADEGEVVSP